uniref:Uncharacterized protein n=1 Tax=Anguilla anguilla TaxID=7936 RepID=A0A0E9RDE8_ANGAN
MRRKMRRRLWRMMRKERMTSQPTAGQRCERVIPASSSFLRLYQIFSPIFKNKTFSYFVLRTHFTGTGHDQVCWEMDV